MSDATIVSVESGVSYYRASAISMPPRCLAASRMQYEQLPPPPALQEAFNEGHRLESSIIRRSAKALSITMVPELTGRQFECIIPVGSRAAIRGHIDGIGDENGIHVGLEAKGLGEDWARTIRTKGIDGIPHYRDQLAVYWEGFDFPKWYFCVHEKANEDPEHEPYIIEVTEPPGDIKALKAKVALVEAGVRAGKGLDEFEYYAHGWCPFAYLHPEKEEDELPLTNDERQIALSQSYADLLAEEKIVAAKKKELREQMEEVFGRDVEVRTPDYKVKISTVTSMRFDQKLFGEHHPDLVKQYKRPSESVRISVQPVSKGSD